MGRRSAFVGRAGWMRAVFSLLLASGVLASCGSEDRATSEATAAVGVPPERANCRRFTTCVPQNPCHTGWVTGCRANEPVCTDIGGWLSNGTTCGDAAVCYMGDCVPCAAGASCTLLDLSGNPDVCRVGAIACGTGQPVCEQAGTARDGTSCSSWGGPYVCKQGQCTPCQDGSWCPLPDLPACHQGIMRQCAETGGTCVDSAVQNGTYCGDGQVCRDGNCVACAQWAACDPGLTCWSGGYTDCSSGTATCVPSQPSPEGEPCGNGLVCSFGACVPPCVQGAACTLPGNTCATGTMSCWSTASGQCVQTGSQRDGTSCGEGLVCSGGSCQPCGPSFYCPPPTSCYGMGTLSCATGLCEPSGAPFADGTACGAGGETCQAGACTGTAGAALVVRSAMGTVDLTNTRWSYCETRELTPRSQLRTDTYLAGGTATHEEQTYESPDCSGDPIPGSGISFDAVLVSAGDRTVGWESYPPPFSLPYSLVATAVHVTGTDRATGQPFEFRTLRYVSDGPWAGPRTIFEGKADGGVAWDGYPTRLVSAYHTETPVCVQDAPCPPATVTCNRWAIDCSSGTAQCTMRDPLPDGSACGWNQECQAGVCLPEPPPVTGTRTTTYWPDGGPVPLPVTAALEALVPQPDGTYLVRTATVDPDGAFSIAGVPERPYLLRLSGGFPLLVETSGRLLDLGQDLLGRPGITRAPGGTQVTLQLTNLAPWATKDAVELASSNTGWMTFPFGRSPIVPTVPAGTTELTRAFDWVNGPLLDPLAGDAAILFQGSVALLPGSTTIGYRAASRWGVIAGPILPGVAQTIALTLAEPAATGQFSATWPVPAWAAHAADVNPAGASAANFSHRLSVMANPWTVPWTQTSPPFWGTQSPDLLSLSAPGSTSADVVVDPITYGRVLPAPYVEYRDVRTIVNVPIPNPSGGTLTWTGSIVRVDRLDGAPADAGPAVTPPLAPLVGGADAFTPQVNVGTGPTLSWSPPALGAPTSYVVMLLAPVPGSTTSVFIRGIAKTSGTSFRFPPGTLAPGETCFATITARQDPAERADAPLRASFEADWASLVTAPFTP